MSVSQHQLRLGLWIKWHKFTWEKISLGGSGFVTANQMPQLFKKKCTLNDLGMSSSQTSLTKRNRWSEAVHKPTDHPRMPLWSLGGFLVSTQEESSKGGAVLEQNCGKRKHVFNWLFNGCLWRWPSSGNHCHLLWFVHFFRGVSICFSCDGGSCGTF